MKKHLLLLAAVAMMIASCTVEKRHYTDGYHVEWHNKNGKGKKVEYTAEAQQTQVAQEQTAQVAQEQTAVSTNEQAVANTDAVTAEEKAVAENTNREVRKQARAAMKAARAEAKEARESMSSNEDVFQGATNFNNASVSSSEPDTVLLVVLAFFISPLAVYLYEGEWTSRCTVNLILWLLCGLPGLIHALVIILGNK